MRDWKGILMLMFDLPAVSSDEKRDYARFHKRLIRLGYLQLQESCYLKLIRNISTAEQTILSLKPMLPPRGNVSILPINLNDFKGMQCLLGEPFNMSLFTDDVVFIRGEEDESA